MHQPQKTGLIVDDEKWVQYVLLKQLELLGYECEFARSGQEALEKVAAKEFDLMMLDMMLDIRMPGISGLKVLQMFRPEHPRTCIVVLTAVVGAFIAADAMRLGADDYLVKALSPRRFSRYDLTPENSNSGKESPPGKIGHSKEGSWHGRGTQRSRS